MQVYIVVSDQKQIGENVRKAFPEHHMDVIDDVWLVAGKDVTSADVTKMLGVGENETLLAIVVNVDSYYGRWDADLWSKISLWKSIDD